MLSFFGASFFHKTNVFETWRISAEYEACFSSSSGEGIKSCCDQNKTLHPSSLWHYIYFTKIRIRNIIHGYKSDLMHASIRPNFFFSSSTTLLYLNVTKKWRGNDPDQARKKLVNHQVMLKLCTTTWLVYTNATLTTKDEMHNTALWDRDKDEEDQVSFRLWELSGWWFYCIVIP